MNSPTETIEAAPADVAQAVANPDLMQMFREMLRDNREGMLEAIQELKKPSAEELEKAATEKQQLLEQTMYAVSMLRMAQVHEGGLHPANSILWSRLSPNLRTDELSRAGQLEWMGACLLLSLPQNLRLQGHRRRGQPEWLER